MDRLIEQKLMKYTNECLPVWCFNDCSHDEYTDTGLF